LDHYDYPLYLSDVFETTKDVESSKLRAQINTILRIKLACHANNIIKLLKNQPHSQAQNSVQTCLDCCAQLDSQKLYLFTAIHAFPGTKYPVNQPVQTRHQHPTPETFSSFKHSWRQVIYTLKFKYLDPFKETKPTLNFIDLHEHT
jgi:hypothetical protein